MSAPIGDAVRDVTGRNMGVCSFDVTGLIVEEHVRPESLQELGFFASSEEK